MQIEHRWVFASELFSQDGQSNDFNTTSVANDGPSNSCFHPDLLTYLQFLSSWVRVDISCFLVADVEGVGLSFIRTSSCFRPFFRWRWYHSQPPQWALSPSGYLIYRFQTYFCWSLLFEQWPFLVAVFPVSQWSPWLPFPFWVESPASQHCGVVTWCEIFWLIFFSQLILTSMGFRRSTVP